MEAADDKSYFMNHLPRFRRTGRYVSQFLNKGNLKSVKKLRDVGIAIESPERNVF